jgi:xanthine dehydrogenase accessory factor
LAMRQVPSQSDWPLYGLVDDIRDAVAQMLASNQNGALATLVQADGPSPRPIGSQILLSEHGLAAGYVSGGCVEASLEAIGQDVLAQGRPRLIRFGGDAPFLDVQLVCGTSISVLIEPFLASDPSWSQLLAARDARMPMVRCLLPNGEVVLKPANRTTRNLELDSTGTSYCRLYNPGQRIVVIGSDPVALALVHLGQTSGFKTKLIRVLGPQLAPKIVHGEYNNMSSLSDLSSEDFDAWTACITTTHDLETDHQILMRALSSDAFYVGALGSIKKRDARVAYLRDAGLSLGQIERLRAPVGLDIGAATPYEIAISILADIIAHARKGTARA